MKNTNICSIIFLRIQEQGKRTDYIGTRKELDRMEKDKGKDIESVLKYFLETDNDLEEYIHNKCIQAVSECQEYIEKENSGLYDEDTLSVMRETLIFKKAFSCAFSQFVQLMMLR